MISGRVYSYVKLAVYAYLFYSNKLRLCLSVVMSDVEKYCCCCMCGGTFDGFCHSVFVPATFFFFFFVIEHFCWLPCHVVTQGNELYYTSGKCFFM